jgi:DNA (cytosine-5)-methyltransferase 1
LRRDLAPSRKTQKGSALDVAGSLGCRGVRSHTELDGHGAYIPEVAGLLGAGDGQRGWRNDLDQGAFIPELARSLNAHASRFDGKSETFIPEIAHTLRSEGFDASEDECGRGTPLVASAIAFERRMVRTTGGQPQEELSHCLRADANAGDGAPCVAFFQDSEFGAKEYDTAGTLRAGREPHHQLATQGLQVRRITPTEAARLQGFPDDYLDITFRGKPACDGPKYKALGNSMAVPCMRWIGERIAAIDAQIYPPGEKNAG